MKRTMVLLALALFFLGVSPAAAQTTEAWTGQYFANRNLEGDPLFTRSDADINFAWGRAAPDPRLPADDFSVRWTRWVQMDTPGRWTMVVTHDDGVRLFVDDNLLIDAWNEQTTSTHTATINLSQSYHLVRLEYFEHAENAEIRLQMISAAFPDWRGDYYANPDLTGPPVFSRNDSTINFNFGSTGPGGGILGAPFSARWTRALYFDAGRYRLTTRTDDGTRLWVDQQLVVNQWHDQVPTRWNGDVTLSTGWHVIRMEYYNHSGTGVASLTIAPVPGSAELWRAEFFDNTNLAGTAVLARDEPQVNFDWGTAAPGAGISSGANWSARFLSKRAAGLAGYYTVAVTADDGVRVYVDNNAVIDEWHDNAAVSFAATVYLNAGVHDWRIEFYQHGGAATLRAQIAPGVSSATSAPAAVIVDDGAGGFFKSSASAGWREVPGGYGKHALVLENNTFSQPLYNWARWYPGLGRPGAYQVSVYVPANVASTRAARYWVAHAGAYDLIRVNQSLYGDEWVSLGTFDFRADGSEYVSLGDVTFETLKSTTIVVDAVRFEPASGGQ